MLVPYSSKDLDLLARLMRAEALNEGDLGMLMVGNVAINRIIADCLDFKTVKTVRDMIFQNPGGFAGVNSSLFFGSSTTKEKRLAERVLMGEQYFPATDALWFYAPADDGVCNPFWYNQPNAGKFKHHCFYKPDPGDCPRLY